MKCTDNELVSVIVATYRRDNSLRTALESISAQTYRNIEIVVVDDNNDKDWNNRVENIVDSMQLQTEIPIRLFVNMENIGSAKTRNKGIDEAKGTYITFLDDDDKYLPSKIEKQISLMIEKNADYSITDLILYNDDNTLCENRRRNFLQTDEKNNLLKCHLKYHMTGTDTMMFRKEYLERIGKFEEIDVGDEFYLMTKAITGNGIFAYLPESHVIAYVHKGEGGLSSGTGKIKGENVLYEYKRKYYNDLAIHDRRYIDMRHHAVLAYAYKRSGNYFMFIVEGLKSFLTTPKDCIELLIGLK